MTVTLPIATGGYRFSGVNDLKQGGTQQGVTQFATAHVMLYASDGQTPLVTANGFHVQGPAAVDAAPSGNPVLIGGQGSTATPADKTTTDGRVVTPWFDRKGRLVVRLGDATNLTPAGDAQARAIQVTHGNGTQTMPSGDALTRPVFVRAGDGTNGMPAGDVAGRAIQVRHSDGTNQTPAGDALARPVFVRLSDPSNAAQWPSAAAMGDSMSNPTTAAVAALQANWNGTSWERANGNTEVVALASSPRTTTTQAPDLVNRNARGVMYALVVTANPGGGQTLNLQVQGAAGGVAQWVMKAMATLTANGTYIYIVMPGAPAAAGAITDTLNAPIPRTIQTLVVHSGAGSWTYVLVACLLL